MKISLEIHLKPHAKRDRIELLESGILEVSVTSPPVDNKANGHLIRFLADKLDLPKNSFEIIRGGHSRNKVVSVDGLTRDEATARISKKESAK